MSLSFYLQDENGHRLERGDDPTNALARLLPKHDDQSFRCLNRIDFYGDTTFNRLQLEDILGELARLRSGGLREEESEVLDEIERLVIRGTSEPHLYLKFVGD